MMKAFDPLKKYSCYEFAVQNPPALIHFLNKEYQQRNHKKALLLREDFCGTAKLASLWALQSPRHRSLGIDLSSEPLEYAEKTHLKKLSPAERKRITLYRGDVRRTPKSAADIVVALNFSYCVFHERKELLAYFKKVNQSLRKGGLFVVDLFGGSRSQDVGIRKTDMGKLIYEWECAAFNPVYNRGTYAIHFKPKGEKRIPFAFVYDWRLWSCPELIELMQEAGFKNVKAYWEGDHPKGRGGDGKFEATEWEENCYIWQSFVIAEK